MESSIGIWVFGEAHRSKLFVPQVWYEEGEFPRLGWKSGTSMIVDAPSSLLHEFVSLAEADDLTIVRFAENWGILGICQHGQPSIHNGCSPLSFDDRSWETSPGQIQWLQEKGSDIRWNVLNRQFYVKVPCWE